MVLITRLKTSGLETLAAIKFWSKTTNVCAVQKMKIFAGNLKLKGLLLQDYVLSIFYVKI